MDIMRLRFILNNRFSLTIACTKKIKLSISYNGKFIFCGIYFIIYIKLNFPFIGKFRFDLSEKAFFIQIYVNFD